MASITLIKNKKEPAYKIRVCCGYDSQNKKIVKTDTYHPDPSLSAKQQEKEAQRYADELERKIKDGVSIDGKKMSFEQFALEWLERRKNSLTYNTYRSYETMIRTKLLPAFGTMKVPNIKLPKIEDFLLSLVEDTSQSSIIKYKTILNRIFKDAIRYGMVERNPCDNVEIPKARKVKEDIKFFTPEQVQTFLNSLDMELEFVIKGHSRIDDTGKAYAVSDYVERHTMPMQLKVFYYISVFCGMRKGEVLALHWEDIDYKAGTINVTKTASKSANGIVCKDPKTKTSVRLLPLPEPIIPLLRQYKREHDAYRLSLGDKWQGDGNLFVQADGRLMDLSTPYQRFKRHIKQYNDWVERQNKELPGGQKKLESLPDIPLHGLRHSCATWLNHINVNILVISKMLGHAQVSTTMNVYAHGFQAQLREASAKMNEDWESRTGKANAQKTAV